MSRRPLPPPLSLPKPGFGRRMPPAAFVPIMGVFGLGLGWRAAAGAYGVTPGIGDLLLGGVTLLYAFALVTWLAKPLRRAYVVLEELRVLPGRAGLAAGSLSLPLLAAALAPFAPGLAVVVLLLGLVVHLGLLAMLLRVMWRGPPEGRVVTPVFHLWFVGFIISGLAANALGFYGTARALVWAMLVPAAVIYALSLRQLLSLVPPPPLRPLLAIHLAPACLLAQVAHGAGMGIAPMLGGVAGVIFVALLIGARWMLASGFSPLWGALTFPLAAFATMLITLSDGQGALGIAGGVALALASPAILVIAWHILRMWPDGKLAARTNAAEA